jgi:hypothetical protein
VPNQQIGSSMGANEMNGVALEKNYMSFCPKIFFSYKLILNDFFANLYNK